MSNHPTRSDVRRHDCLYSPGGPETLWSGPPGVCLSAEVVELLGPGEDVSGEIVQLAPDRPDAGHDYLFIFKQVRNL